MLYDYFAAKLERGPKKSFHSSALLAIISCPSLFCFVPTSLIFCSQYILLSNINSNHAFTELITLPNVADCSFLMPPYLHKI